jgi:hypothetical protein
LVVYHYGSLIGKEAKPLVFPKEKSAKHYILHREENQYAEITLKTGERGWSFR